MRAFLRVPAVVHHDKNYSPNLLSLNMEVSLRKVGQKKRSYLFTAVLHTVVNVVFPSENMRT